MQGWPGNIKKKDCDGGRCTSNERSEWAVRLNITGNPFNLSVLDHNFYAKSEDVLLKLSHLIHWQ